MSATNQGITFTWSTNDNTHVAEATLDDAATMVDCTALADLFTDNRAGTGNPTGAFTLLLAKSPTVPAVGAVGDLTVGTMTRKMIVQSVGYGGPVNGARTARVSLASTRAT